MSKGYTYHQEGIIYFIRAEGVPLIKIGWTQKHPEDRMAEIARQSPLPLTLIGCLAGSPTDELELHGLFVFSRDHNEWFRATPDLIDWMKEYVRPGEDWPFTPLVLKPMTYAEHLAAGSA